MTSPDSSELPPLPPNWDDLDVFNSNPEFHHYTTLGGLTGIVSTNTLWATHFEDLNDATELMVIRKPLEDELSVRFRRMVEEICRRYPEAREVTDAAGGIEAAAAKEAKVMIGLLYASTFTTEDGLEGVKDLNGPAFITSFCRHTGEPYERDNGLLSQWRGYGGAGGFCVVFDSSGLLRLFDKEHAAHAYMRLTVNPATYLYPGTPVLEAFPKLRATCEGFMARLLDGTATGEDSPDIITEFVHAALTCKHHAFHEEREVRVAVQPATEGWRAAIGRERKWTVPPAKQPREVGGLNRVVLFDGLGEKLPIRRVIVGPSIDQERNLSHARSLLGPDVPVVLSETPYVDRAGLPRP